MLKLSNVLRTRVRSDSLMRCPAIKQKHDEVKVKSFDQIPIVNRKLLQNPNVKRIHEEWHQKMIDYGPIFKERKYPGDEYTIFCCSPNDNRTIFHADGRMPVRENLTNLIHARKYLNLPLGLMNENGEDWYRMRVCMNRYMLSNSHVWSCIKPQLDATKTLLKYIEDNCDDKRKVTQFDKVLHCWAFDMTGIFALNTNLNSMVDIDHSSKSRQMVHCTLQMFDRMAKTLFSFPMWKYKMTKDMKELIYLQEQQLNLAEHFISTNNKTSFHGSMVEYIMNNSKIYDSEKLLLISDMLLAGIDTTANAAVFTLYCLALNQHVQNKLRNEIHNLTSNKEDITGKILDRMTYMKACIKETQRMFPFVTSFSRRNNKDIILSGYHIPKGTNLLSISNCVNNFNPRYFDDPHTFKPERWLDRTLMRKHGLALTGPFGMGARKCLGRKFAIQEIQLLLIVLLQNYSVSYHGEPLEVTFNLVSYPSVSPEFQFKTLT